MKLCAIDKDALFENMSQGCAYCRLLSEEGGAADFIFDAVNPSFYKLTGFSQVEGRRFSEMLPGILESNSGLIENIGRVVMTGSAECFEIYIHGLDLWFDFSVWPLKGDGFAAVFDSISERKVFEKKLFESEDRFRQMFESNADIKLIVEEKTGVISDANQSAADFYGWSIDELRRMHLHDLTVLCPTEVERHLARFRKSPQNKALFRHRKANGSIRDVEVFSNRIDSGENARIHSIIRDVTECKRYDAIRAFHIRLHEMAREHSIEDLLRFALSEAERHTGSSSAFCQFLDEESRLPALHVWSFSARQEFAGQKEYSRAHPSLHDPDIWVELLKEKRIVVNNDEAKLMAFHKTPASHSAVKRELVLPIMNGEHLVAVFGLFNKHLDYDAEDSRTLEIIADITLDIVARKRAEHSELQAHETVIQLQKMAMIGRLAGGIAHDFNNMLGVILGHCEMALEQDGLARSVYIDLKAILKAASRSADLTNQLLAFARKQTILPKVIDLNTMVEGMLSMLRRLIGEEITLSWQPSEESARILFDPTQLDQILVNLCINARDAIKGQGSIVIETGRLSHHRPAGQPHFPGANAGDHVTLSVSDNGCGIEKKDIPHIFEPFFTTKDVGKGTGLGLSMVYGIVEQNHGCIECESQPGKGTSIKIHIPLYTNQMELDYGPPEEYLSTRGKGRILLVEDEADILQLCRLMLEKNGYSVEAVATPKEALFIAKQPGSHFDLLLIDVVLPEMDGCELSRVLTDLSPGLKTLFMSGYTSEVISTYLEFEEGVNFIQKPFTFHSLGISVQNMLAASPASSVWAG